MTETTSTTSTATTISGVIGKDWSWVLSHLLALIVVGGLIIGGVYGVESLIARHDSATASKYSAILAAQTTATQILQKQLQADEEQSAQIEAQLLAQNSQLAQQISARNQAAATQVKTDATLSAADSANRITVQTKAGPGEVTAQGNDVVLDLPITRAVVADLDELPVVEANLTDTQKQLANETTVATNAQSDVADAKKVIAAQVTQMADADKACKAQITTLKSQNRKNTWKHLLLGGAIFEGIRLYLTGKL
jgi:hypothetical protein